MKKISIILLTGVFTIVFAWSGQELNKNYFGYNKNNEIHLEISNIQLSQKICENVNFYNYLNYKIDINQSDYIEIKNANNYSIAFYKNQELFSVHFSDGKTGEPSPLSIQNYKVERHSKYFTMSLMPEEILRAIPISPNMIFYSGLQSNIDENLWLFVERNVETTTYNLCLYNHSSKTKSILFSQSNSPEVRYAFKPIAWSDNSSTVYLESIDFGSSTEHEGIWEYNLSTKTVRRININSNYSTTPLISYDGRYFLYCATTAKKDIHVPSTQVLVFDLGTNREVVIAKDEKASFVMAEWLKSSE